ncbi:phage major capsid protein [Orrella sp. 11846]|uniref:phage major capsid protein n=1 Tax=Orrella sp. 11846 TaxID=3409913 RepID=UPI003B5A4899
MDKNEQNTLEKEYKQVQQGLKDVSEQLKNYADKSKTELSEVNKLGDELSKKVENSLSEFNKLSARLQEVEQNLARPKNEGDPAPRTPGEIVVASQEMEGVNSSFRGSRRISVPRSAITSLDNSGGDLVQPDRVPGIVMPGTRRMTLRDLIAPGRTSSNSVEYVRESGFTNNADVVSEGASKPYSDLTFELENAPVRVIAHLFKASRQILDDAPALQSYIDARARYALELAEEAQFLYGSGQGANLTGIIPQAEAFDPEFSPDKEQAIDRIRLAILQAILAEFPPNGIVLNPIDWARIELTKDEEGRYILGNPGSGAQPLLWSLPVVSTTAIVQDQFLVGAFSLGAQVFDRQDAEVLISTENDKDFEKNMVTIRAEERIGLAVYRPESFVEGSVTGASS